MRTDEALTLLKEEDETVRHVYREAELSELFGVDGEDLKALIAVLESKEILQHAALDIYVYRQSNHMGMKTFHMIVQALRPNDIVYESLEYAASKYGIISQIPTVFTCMTTGEEGWYETCLGRVEFAHTDASVEEIRANTINREKYDEIPFATEEYAEHDLRLLNRCVDLLEEQRIKTYGGVIGTVHYYPCVDDDDEQEKKQNINNQCR